MCVLLLFVQRFSVLVFISVFVVWSVVHMQWHVEVLRLDIDGDGGGIC